MVRLNENLVISIIVIIFKNNFK